MLQTIERIMAAVGLPATVENYHRIHSAITGSDEAMAALVWDLIGGGE